MTAASNTHEPKFKLKEICGLLDVDYDDARYVLALGVLPETYVEAAPGRGNHRVFNHAQALTLAVILKLRAAGVSTAVARAIADWPSVADSKFGIPTWNPQIAVLAHKLAAEYELFLEIGDARWVRGVVNSDPKNKLSQVSPWIDMKTRRVAQIERPAVVFRIDVLRIAHLLLPPDSSVK